MGHVFVEAQLAGLKTAERVKMLVDTGATLTTVSSDLAQRLGIPTLKPSKVRLADGREVEAKAGVVGLKVNGREAPTTVLVMGEEPCLGEPLLGRRDPGSFGARSKPHDRRV
jgi:predicted aspartyl protease